MVAMEVASDGDGTKLDMVEVESRSEEITCWPARLYMIGDVRELSNQGMRRKRGHRNGNLKFATAESGCCYGDVRRVDLIAQLHPGPDFNRNSVHMHPQSSDKSVRQ